MTPKEIADLKEGDVFFYSDWKGNKEIHYVTYATEDNKLVHTISLQKRGTAKKGLLRENERYATALLCHQYATIQNCHEGRWVQRAIETIDKMLGTVRGKFMEARND